MQKDTVEPDVITYSAIANQGLGVRGLELMGRMTSLSSENLRESGVWVQVHGNSPDFHAVFICFHGCSVGFDRVSAVFRSFSSISVKRLGSKIS